MAYTTTLSKSDQGSSLDLWNKVWDIKLDIVKDEKKRKDMNKAYTNIRNKVRANDIVCGKRGLSVGDKHPNPFAYMVNQAIYAEEHGKFRPTDAECEIIKMWISCAMGEYKNFHAEQIKERLFEVV